jgi:hypothetical protein
MIQLKVVAIVRARPSVVRSPLWILTRPILLHAQRAEDLLVHLK